MKLLVKVKFANLINIINDKEVIPELLQSECNSKEIYSSVNYLLNHPELINAQLECIKNTLKTIKTNESSSKNAANILSQYL